MSDKQVDDIIDHIDRVLDVIRSKHYALVLSDYLFYINQIKEKVEGLKQ